MKIEPVSVSNSESDDILYSHSDKLISMLKFNKWSHNLVFSLERRVQTVVAVIDFSKANENCSVVTPLIKIFGNGTLKFFIIFIC